MALLDGIVGCWSPSLGATGYRLVDRTPYNGHATLTNMDAGTDWVATPCGVSLDFDGSDDRASCGALPWLGANTLTISLWCKPNTLTAAQKSMASQIDATGNIGRAFRQHNTQLEWTLASSGSAYRVWRSASSLLTLNWQHVAVIAVGTNTPRFFVNGVESTTSLAASAGTPTVPAAQPFSIGYDGGFSQTLYNFAGQIGEVAVFSAFADVARIFQLGNGWIGRELTGMNRRQRFGRVASSLRRRLLLLGQE